VNGPLSVAVSRGAIVESEHLVDVVAVRDGETILAAGATDHVLCWRSSAKPFQALPLARARPDLPDRELAIACASHRAEPEQIDAVRALLAAAPAREEELECGSQDGRPPGPLHHNCSGKHAGMLALCRARSWPSEGYRLPEHPVQQAILAALAEATELPPEQIPLALDGCGVPTFGATLERMAHAFTRLERLDGGRRIADAMRLHPALIGGAGQIDTQLMEAFPGLVAKGGAEGLLCLVTAGGVGVALKSRDGNPRPQRIALQLVFERLGLGEPPQSLLQSHVRNSRNEIVGSLSGKWTEPV
jgi:L-asparaginase II